MMTCRALLEKHELLARRRERSAEHIARVRERFTSLDYLRNLPVSVFCAGSLARMEIGEKSDLDLFVTADRSPILQSRLCEYTLIAHLIQLNEALGFPPFSDDGEYLKICFIDDLKTRTGSRRDDSENLFTTRMLLILESQPLVHDDVYNRHLTETLELYYRDNKGKRSFRPLFLLNDLLRYWRTVCLNYEERRHDPDKPWRKKNINLKFSRMMTVFSTVLPLIVKPVTSVTELRELCSKTPLERLAFGLDLLEDDPLRNEWPEVLDIYETFLTWKDDNDVEKYLEGGNQKETVRSYAEKFSAFLHKALTHSRIPMEYRRYLLL